MGADSSASNRSDLTLGLSLAEIMLLLVFILLIVWSHAVGEPTGSDADVSKAMLQEQLDLLKVENASLRLDLDAARTETDQTNQKYKELLGMLGAKGGSRPEIERAIEDIRAAAKRGAPKCQDENTLLAARVDNGKFSVLLSTPLPSEVGAIVSRMQATPAGEISDESWLATFLAEVWQMERSRKCRFDYSLRYRTDTDYREGREFFERYFYLAAKQRLD